MSCEFWRFKSISLLRMWSIVNVSAAGRHTMSSLPIPSKSRLLLVKGRQSLLKCEDKRLCRSAASSPALLRPPDSRSDRKLELMQPRIGWNWKSVTHNNSSLSCQDYRALFIIHESQNRQNEALSGFTEHQNKTNKKANKLFIYLFVC